MSAAQSAFWTLLFWYGVAVPTSLIGGVGALAGGSVAGLPMLLFGGVSINSSVAGTYLSIKYRSWRLLWTLPALVVPFAFVLASHMMAGPPMGPGRVEVPAGDIHAANACFIALTIIAFGVMAWGLWPRWDVAAAIAAFCVTLSIVAYWLGQVAFAHTVL